MVPFLVSIPHSGERVPREATWLMGQDPLILLCDVDRFVDILYKPGVTQLKIPVVVTEWHRYAADLNRFPEDVDESTVMGSKNKKGMFNRGFHWAITTKNQVLMKEPISEALHKEITQKYFEPFHARIRQIVEEFRRQGHKTIYHIDAHSMPGVGTKEHRDPGEKRADIVVSDVKGTSCSTEFKDCVIKAYEDQGFKVGYNWPYYGGRVTETYGHPAKGHHAIQVEMNRSLYMNEETKELRTDQLTSVQDRVLAALKQVHSFVSQI